MAETNARPKDAALGTGLGRVLLLVYGIFALYASARALVQIATHFSEAPLAYLLSAFAGLVYIAATYGLARGGRSSTPSSPPARRCPRSTSAQAYGSMRRSMSRTGM